MSFELSAITYDPLRKRNLFTESFSPETNSTVKSIRTTPYNFDFTLSIYVRNTEDGTQIIEQILPFFKPEWTYTVKLIDNIDPIDIPLILNSVNMEDLYESDFREVDYASLGKHNIYFFDGPHEEQDQYDGLSLALPALDDTFILLIDDWNDPRPRDGTERAIKELGIEVLYSIQIRTSNGVDVVYPTPHVLENSDWHNGYYFAVCKK
jgi:hypothetical protein